MSADIPQFTHFAYLGADAEKFLQGQVTVNIGRLDPEHYQATAICDLKGRIHFGLWLRRHSAEHLDIVISADLAEELAQHIKKYGAFSKAQLQPQAPIYPAVIAQQASFSPNPELAIPLETWQALAIDQGQAWISQATSHLFQPQELRLHQRGGVDYDKGCYLGQEIIARLWFKAKPKHWLHLIAAEGQPPSAGAQLNHDVQIVNSIATATGWKALVSAKPEALQQLAVQQLNLPQALNGDVARSK
jgi:folate-binding protein YgfZ